MKPPDKDTPFTAAPERRKYSTPVIRTYGTIRAITRNAGTMGALSDGAGMTSKTS